MPTARLLLTYSFRRLLYTDRDATCNPRTVTAVLVHAGVGGGATVQVSHS